jgi:hypothetical protein
MESVEIILVSNSSKAVELSSNVSFADSSGTYENGEFHCNDGLIYAAFDDNYLLLSLNVLLLIRILISSIFM